MGEILRDNSMLASRADPRVPLVFAISSKMSSTPTQLCLFRNYNYNGGEKEDAFVQDPIEARKELDLEPEDDVMRSISGGGGQKVVLPSCTPRPGKASRHPGKLPFTDHCSLALSTFIVVFILFAFYHHPLMHTYRIFSCTTTGCYACYNCCTDCV